MRELPVKFLLDDDQMRRLEEASKRYVAKGYTAAGNIENLFDTTMQMGSKSFIEEKLHFLEVNSKGVEPNRDFIQEKLGESQEQEAAKISEADLKEWNKRQIDLIKWNKQLQDEGLFCSTNVLEDSFEQYQNGADFKELVNELIELESYGNILLEERGLQVPFYTLKASFEEYKQGTGIDEIAEQIKEGKYDAPLTEYQPVSKEQVEHTEFQEQAQTGQKKSESGIKNEGTLIKQEIKSQGYRPKPGLVKNINQLNKMMDKSHSLKDISKMYKEKSLQESNPEAQKLVDKIGNELKGQELAKVVFSR